MNVLPTKNGQQFTIKLSQFIADKKNELGQLADEISDINTELTADYCELLCEHLRRGGLVQLSIIEQLDSGKQFYFKKHFSHAIL
jgi:hypothetical protein